MKKLEDLTKDFWVASGICISMITLSGIATYKVLSANKNFYESNPIANWFIQKWGLEKGLSLHSITGAALVMGWNYLLSNSKDYGKLERCLLYATALSETYMAMNDIYLYLKQYWNLN